MDTDIDVFEALNLIANAKFRPFDKNDWMAFSGCESENPLIAYGVSFGTPIPLSSEDLFTVIIDGDNINIIAEYDGNSGQVFRLKEI